LLCCGLLDHPCPAFAVTSVFGVYVAPSSAHGAPSTVHDSILGRKAGLFVLPYKEVSVAHPALSTNGTEVAATGE
jgi:hypothetical protein